MSLYLSPECGIGGLGRVLMLCLLGLKCFASDGSCMTGAGIVLAFGWCDKLSVCRDFSSMKL